MFRPVMTKVIGFPLKASRAAHGNARVNLEK
jgi:hypothetical protein